MSTLKLNNIKLKKLTTTVSSRSNIKLRQAKIGQYKGKNVHDETTNRLCTSVGQNDGKTVNFRRFLQKKLLRSLLEDE